MEKPFSCSICQKAFAKLNSLGDHVENVHILQKSSEKSQENHSDFGKSNQSESNCEEINSENNSDPNNIENFIVDQSESDCVEIQNQVEILIKDYPNDLKDHLREAFAKLNSPGDHVETVNVLKKSENGQKNHSDPKNIENSIVDQAGDHVESVHILQTLSKNTHENHSDPKSNQNSLESDCEKIQIQNLAHKESKTSQGNHSDSKNTKGQLISE